MRRDETPFQRLCFVWAMVVILTVAVASIALLLVLRGTSAIWPTLGVLGTYQLIGKWIVFSGLSPDRTFGFGPWSLAYMTFVADLTYALVLTSALAALERMRWIGPMLVHARTKADQAFHSYPALRRMAFGGVALFVFLPLPASGPVGGSFAARLAGLSRAAALGAIGMAAALNGVLFALLAQLLGSQAETMLRNPQVTVVIGLVFLALVWFTWRHVRRRLQA